MAVLKFAPKREEAGNAPGANRKQRCRYDRSTMGVRVLSQVSTARWRQIGRPTHHGEAGGVRPGNSLATNKPPRGVSKIERTGTTHADPLVSGAAGGSGPQPQETVGRCSNWESKWRPTFGRKAPAHGAYARLWRGGKGRNLNNAKGKNKKLIKGKNRFIMYVTHVQNSS